MTREQHLAILRDKLAASERMGSGYDDRVAAIRAEIERLEREE